MDSSTVITPSLPTFFIASAMMLPMVESLLAEMLPTWAGFARLENWGCTIPVERDLGPGQADLFTVDATAGQVLRVVGDQKDVNVWLRIVDPEGKALATADRPNNGSGPQAMSAIVPRSGSLQIEVAIAPEYYVCRPIRHRTDLRDPTEKDRLRIDAETKLFAAIAEGRAADAASRRKAIGV